MLRRDFITRMGFSAIAALLIPVLKTSATAENPKMTDTDWVYIGQDPQSLDSFFHRKICNATQAECDNFVSRMHGDYVMTTTLHKNTGLIDFTIKFRDPSCVTINDRWLSRYKTQELLSIAT